LNILLLDDDNNTKELLAHYINMEESWNYFHIDFLHDTDPIYKNIDVVVIDYLKDKYKNILDEILLLNKEIRTIIISDKLEYSSKEGCDYCESNYKRKRLLKPIEPTKLYDLIKNFDQNSCGYYQSFDNIKDILPNIVKRFLYLEYDYATHQVISKHQNLTSRYTYELVSFVNILEKNNIQYTIIDEYTIKLY
jgi:hypothetical protein